jgi:protein tyrosine/serine phosphatase
MHCLRNYAEAKQNVLGLRGNSNDFAGFSGALIKKIIYLLANTVK